MALTPAQQTAVLTLIAQEGGIENLTNEVRVLNAQNNNQITLAAIASAISVTVSDFTAFTKIPDSVALDRNAIIAILQAIQAAVTSQNASVLGPLFIALYVAAKRQAGI